MVLVEIASPQKRNRYKNNDNIDGEKNPAYVLPESLSICLSIYLSIYPSIYLAIYLFIYLSTIYIFILYTFSLKTRRILWPKWPHRSNLKETRGFQVKPGVLPKHILIPRVSIYTRTIVRVSKLRVYKQYVSF